MRGGIFGFSVLELVFLFVMLIYNRQIFRLIHRAIMGGYANDADNKETNSTQSAEVQALAKTQKQIDAIPVAPTNLKLNKIAYSEIALKLYDCMNISGTDVDTMFKLLSGKNADELKMIFKEFGKKNNYTFGYAFLENADLIQFFQDELSGADLEKMKNIWKPTGLWYYK